MFVAIAVIAVSVGLLANGSCKCVAVLSSKKKTDDMMRRRGTSKYISTSLSEIDKVMTNR